MTNQGDDDELSQGGDEDGVLLSVDEPGSDRRVAVEDDGRAVYAYLLHGESFVSHVWLYNTVETPELPEWGSPELMPFRNSSEYCVADSVQRLAPDSVVSCIWFDQGAFVFIDGVLMARLEEGSLPGWSVNAAQDSPVAKCFDKTKRGGIG